MNSFDALHLLLAKISNRERGRTLSEKQYQIQ
jgi:hypothetical protein